MICLVIVLVIGLLTCSLQTAAGVFVSFRLSRSIALIVFDGGDSVHYYPGVPALQLQPAASQTQAESACMTADAVLISTTRCRYCCLLLLFSTELSCKSAFVRVDNLQFFIICGFLATREPT